MRESRFAEKQIMSLLMEREAVAPTADERRGHGIGAVAF